MDLTMEQTCSRAEYEARITYLIQEDDSAFTKIGVTKNSWSLHRRHQNLQTGNPHILTVVEVIEFSEHRQAYNLEQRVLNTLAAWRVRDTEWLRLHPAQIRHFIITGEMPEKETK
jgi:hypothetical protein